MVEVAAARSRGATTIRANTTPPPPANEKLKALEGRLKQLQEGGPRRPLVMSVREEERIEDTYIHVRGSVHNRGAAVPRGFLQAATLSKPAVIDPGQSGRRELADWIVDPSNPLTARVMVNRVWHWLFGAGLVRTTDNFGTTGEAPSHPELLDHLATKFIEQGWSVKKLVREVMLSRTYQLRSNPGRDDFGLEGQGTRGTRPSEIDPENRLLWRASRRRLDAEGIRDTMLAVSGELKEERGGPTFPANLSADYGFHPVELRRSVYLPVFRNVLPEVFEVFDFADPSMVTGARNVSTVAPQALFLMNHPFVRERARAAARRLLQADLTEKARLERAYRLTLGRSPAEGEVAVVEKVLASERDAEAAWAEVFHALFASPDFRYIN
jgi:hypothetical protein